MNEQKLMDAVAAATGRARRQPARQSTRSSRRSLTPSRPPRPIQPIGFGSFSTGTRNARVARRLTYVPMAYFRAKKSFAIGHGSYTEADGRAPSAGVACAPWWRRGVNGPGELNRGCQSGQWSCRFRSESSECIELPASLMLASRLPACWQARSARSPIRSRSSTHCRI